MTVALHPPLDDMARVLSRVALFRGTDLGDEREALAVLRAAFPHADLDRGFGAALELARTRAPQNARLSEAAGQIGEVVGFGLWIVLFVVAWCVLCPLPAQADEALAPSHAGLLTQLAPLAIGALLAGFVLHTMLPRRRSVVDEASAEADGADEVVRWDGDGR